MTMWLLDFYVSLTILKNQFVIQAYICVAFLTALGRKLNKQTKDKTMVWKEIKFPHYKIHVAVQK